MLMLIGCNALFRHIGVIAMENGKIGTRCSQAPVSVLTIRTGAGGKCMRIAVGASRRMTPRIARDGKISHLLNQAFATHKQIDHRHLRNQYLVHVWSYPAGCLFT
jgi:hypothetical protein